MVAQVAAEDPDTAAKMVQPITLVCSSRPGKRLTQGARPRNMLSLSFVRKRISPIQTKSGSAVSVQLEAAPQTVTAMASPAGRAENSSMPIQATPARVRPIHTLLPRRANSEMISKVVMATSFMVQSLLGLNCFSSALQLQHPVVHEGDEQDDGADGHRNLRYPQRRGVAAGRHVVDGTRDPGQAYRVEGEQTREEHGRRKRPHLQGMALAALELGQQQCDADVLVAFERVGERQKA